LWTSKWTWSIVLLSRAGPGPNLEAPPSGHGVGWNNVLYEATPEVAHYSARGFGLANDLSSRVVFFDL
jgi:hypothetical protein